MVKRLRQATKEYAHHPPHPRPAFPRSVSLPPSLRVHLWSSLLPAPRLERDAWSMVKLQRQTTNEYTPFPRVRVYSSSFYPSPPLSFFSLLSFSFSPRVCVFSLTPPFSCALGARTSDERAFRGRGGPLPGDNRSRNGAVVGRWAGKVRALSTGAGNIWVDGQTR